MQIETTTLEGVLIVQPARFGDSRGYFFESFQSQRCLSFWDSSKDYQDNVSWSTQGVIRGLHFQNPEGQAKLVSVLYGKVNDIIVDIRQGSPTFGQHIVVELSQENGRQVFIPAGFAHGFEVLSENALFSYKCSPLYAPHCDRGINPFDPELGIKWESASPVVSDKDLKHPNLKELSAEALPTYSS
jgi:dTDP-4-dehydrorhamnose 3,5-epimerase